MNQPPPCILKDKAARLAALHREGPILVLPNVWDPLGARMLERLDFPAVATASAAIAWSRGLPDGEVLPFDDMLDAVAAIAAAVDLPVTADLESGYGEAPEAVAANVARAIGVGVVGANLEDSRAGRMLSIEDQQARLRAVRAAADALDVPFVLNARTDVFLRREGSIDASLDEAIERAIAYREAGADVLYPIGLDDRDGLARLVGATALPINVFARASTPPLGELEAIGVRRMSLGPGMLKVAMGAMRRLAIEVAAGGRFDPDRDGLSSAEIEGLIREPRTIEEK